jgi:Carboxypeptidase regulatory-like domain
MIRRLHNSALCLGVFVRAMLSVLFCALSALAQTQQASPLPGVQNVSPAPQGTAKSAGEQPSGQGLAGSISGNVTDQSGSPVIEARVTLSREDESPIQELMSGNNGEFSFANIAPGPFHLTVTAAAFTAQSVAGILHPGENYSVPLIVLAVAAVVTAIKVTPSRPEIAQYQLEKQEKQRVLGFIPNFYVTYFPNTVPLNARQKMDLVWKSTVDPVTFLGIGVVAGVEQGLDNYRGYGQGAQGYGKRQCAIPVSLCDCKFGDLQG